METFYPIAFVDSLDKVELSSIAPAHNKCSYCWLPFGVTDKDLQSKAAIAEDPMDVDVEAALGAFQILPFDISPSNNDPVRAPCGHIFGYGCFIDSLQHVSASCPICRVDFDRPAYAEDSDSWTDSEDED
jgi:hypothetical protein